MFDQRMPYNANVGKRLWMRRHISVSILWLGSLSVLTTIGPPGIVKNHSSCAVITALE
jgi:hypothetical protein